MGVVPEAERHVVHGQLEDALGVAGEVRPQRLVRGAEKDRLVPQEGARRVDATASAARRAFASSSWPVRRRSATSIPPARIISGDSASACRTSRRPCVAGRPLAGGEAAELQERRGAPGRERRRLVPGEAGLLRLAEGGVGEAEVVERLGVVAPPRDGLRERLDRFVVALELDGEASRGPLELRAVGKRRERRRVDVVGLEELPVQLLVAAELHPVALAPLLRRREDVGRLRAGLHLRLRHDVVAALGVGEEHAALLVADLDGVAARPPRGRRRCDRRRRRASRLEGLLADRRRPVADDDPAATDGPRHVEADAQHAALAPPHVHDALVVRARDSRRSSAPAGTVSRNRRSCWGSRNA